MGDGFWSKFSKGIAVTGTVVAGGAAVASAVNGLINSNQKRKRDKFEMQLEAQNAALRQQQQLLDQEIKLKELELKRHQIDTQANRDITVTQINADRDVNVQNMQSQASMQNTSVNAQADVLKTQAIYSPNSALAGRQGYISDAENGITVDSRNVNFSSCYGPTVYPSNMGMMQAGSVGFNNNQNHINNSGSNMNQLQQKLLDAKNLFDQGIITQEEFSKLKENILKQFC